MDHTRGKDLISGGLRRSSPLQVLLLQHLADNVHHRLKSDAELHNRQVVLQLYFIAQLSVEGVHAGRIHLQVHILQLALECHDQWGTLASSALNSP